MRVRLPRGVWRSSRGSYKKQLSESVRPSAPGQICSASISRPRTAGTRAGSNESHEMENKSVTCAPLHRTHGDKLTQFLFMMEREL